MVAPMIDMDRIQELRAEIGECDLDLVLDLFLAEAEETIGRLAAAGGAVDLARASHFLHGGALNMGLRAFASTAAAIGADPTHDAARAAERLCAVLERTREAVGALRA